MNKTIIVQTGIQRLYICFSRGFDKKDKIDIGL